MQFQYLWGIAIVLLTLLGTVAAFLAAQRSGKQNGISAKIQSVTTVAILFVLIHNIYWEREVNEMASKGWSLLCTFPPFLVCFSISIILTVAFTINTRRLQADRTAPTEQNES